MEKECNRTNLANSSWFNGLVSTGQFYNPLTKKRNIEAPNETKEISVVSSSVDLSTKIINNEGKKEANFVNVAHMIYDYKQAKDGEIKKQSQMKNSLQ